MKSPVNMDTLSHSNPFTGNLFLIPLRHNLFVSKTDIWIIVKSFIYLHFVFTYQYTTWNIAPVMPFSTINSILIWVNKSNSVLFFLTLELIINQGHNQVTYIYLEIFQKHCTVTGYYLAHIGCDNHPNTSCLKYPKHFFAWL